MGAGASSSGASEQVCFGYWDTSSNSIHMVRLNSTSSSMQDSDSSAHEDEEHSNSSDNGTAAPSPQQITNKGRKLSDTAVLPKRFKLRHTKSGGYKRLESSGGNTKTGKETVERRLSSVKLQEMESVDMPLKAAKILVGNPMRIKMEKEYIDSDEDSDIPINANFDIVQVCGEKPKQTTLPQLSTSSSLVMQSSSHSATVLSTSDTVITMVLPRKAAKLLLGDGQASNGSLKSKDRYGAIAGGSQLSRAHGKYTHLPAHSSSPSRIMPITSSHC